MLARPLLVCLTLFAAASSSDAARAAGPAIVIESPSGMQVFQRRTLDSGPAVISGGLPTTADSARYRVNGTSLRGKLSGGWTTIPIGTNHQFRVEANLPAGGWYSLDVEALGHDKPLATATVDKFGVGEVFITAGQSNSTNCGQFRTKQASGMVASFDGKRWAAAADPMPGAHDIVGRSPPLFYGGSPWLAFGDGLYEKFKVPVGVVVTGYGGSSVSQWLPDAPRGNEAQNMFDYMMVRIKLLGPHGFRGVLWHQGESDVKNPTDEYVAKLTRVIKESNRQAGWDFPWFVAKVSYHSPAMPRANTTRDAQQKLWDTGVAQPGPDTDTLVGQDRDTDGKGIHLSLSGLKKHGQMWAECVGTYLDKQPRGK